MGKNPRDLEGLPEKVENDGFFLVTDNNTASLDEAQPELGGATIDKKLPKISGGEAQLAVNQGDVNNLV